VTAAEQGRLKRLEARVTAATKAREEQEARERRDRIIGILRSKVHSVLAEARQAKAEAIQAAMETVHELADGHRAAEQHSTRDRLRQMMSKLGRASL
jgi:hypothetical protein